jgi:hypothetical protein
VRSVRRKGEAGASAPSGPKTKKAGLSARLLSP